MQRLVVVLIAAACSKEPAPAAGPTETEAVSHFKRIENEFRTMETGIAIALGDHVFRCGAAPDQEKLAMSIASLQNWLPANQKSAKWVDVWFDCGDKEQSVYSSTWVGGRGGKAIDQGGDTTLSWGTFAAKQASLVGINVVSRAIKAPEQLRVSAYYALP